MTGRGARAISGIGLLVLGLWLGCLDTESAGASAFNHEHSRWAEVLSRHVAGGRVNYRGIAANPGGLEAYLEDLARVKRAEFRRWGRANQIAFLLNLYNAATLDLVVRHYPVASIRDIGTIFRGPWKQESVRLWGERVTLDHVEHGLLRRDYSEPRIHFALVCAARSCPPLRAEPYRGDQLDRQLDEQGRVFLAQESKNRVDPEGRVVYLSPIFEWFQSDFTSRGKSVLQFAVPYFPDVIPGKSSGFEGFSVRHTEYDWGLNDSNRE